MNITENSKPKGSIIIIAASSGTGKTSLVKELVNNIDNLDVSVSHTTRSPRPQEINGIHYHFTSSDDFQKNITSNSFLEYAEVFGNFYGTSKQSVQEQIDLGNDVILEIDWQGALQVKELFFTTNIIMIFILPPSKEALRERLSNRGQDSEDVIATRLAGSVTEMRQYDNFDYLIINDNFDKALNELTGIILSNRLNTLTQKMNHNDVITALLTE